MADLCAICCVSFIGLVTPPAISISMPLFGKKTNSDKSSKGKEEKKEAKTTPTVEDKYDLKDVLGT